MGFLNVEKAHGESVTSPAAPLLSVYYCRPAVDRQPSRRTWQSLGCQSAVCGVLEASQQLPTSARAPSRRGTIRSVVRAGTRSREGSRSLRRCATHARQELFGAAVRDPARFSHRSGRLGPNQRQLQIRAPKQAPRWSRGPCPYLGLHQSPGTMDRSQVTKPIGCD